MNSICYVLDGHKTHFTDKQFCLLLLLFGFKSKRLNTIYYQWLPVSSAGFDELNDTFTQLFKRLLSKTREW